MAAQGPVVFETKSIQDFIRYVLAHHKPPSTLVVCSSKEPFLHALQLEARSVPSPTDNRNNDTTVDEATLAKHLLHTPTLRLLSTARTLKLAFCQDITHLRAYLATYSNSITNRHMEIDTALRQPDVRPVLAILSPVQLHRSTSTFSAQGLNCTFSVAVEAAHQTGSRLVMAEIAYQSTNTEDEADLRTPPSNITPHPWDEEVSILNVTTKRLGELSSGRIVKIKAIASRWCDFQELPTLEGMI
ncbi:hypothetical protein CLAFUW4_11951 [Fulvia fulva]|uniref:Uncharacterized protein n=1 Tax=Passalora fulva TaxID=5499 RepID=A0A9Q8PDN0_PASFU|nr:uncharacterized protein CLAFUR5_10993 [Fulvia fulva]KAK4618050.1 hypothetical protein CLAFUR4_11956 [Fulvia fulva]KAK4618416.1 hypothetical protein CLAFUR0_11967 [Fulvia fulva]UJO20639.1 hypothetical protein CLAFUR5_10993 [Fulvia fulva]WPV17900.1 hypothetical protein CLAFUW4_11951 [Fulvia fulva]WPV32854.1 hypothetical protein CLAFUW7_11958 [Fulvia fulva]